MEQLNKKQLEINEIVAEKDAEIDQHNKKLSL